MKQAIIFGATGRMGTEISLSASRRNDISILGGITQEGEPSVGKVIPNIELPIASSWEDSFDSADVIIDFSSPEGTLLALEAAYQRKIPILIGTTGVPESYTPFFKKTSEVVPVIRASNTSVGVNVMLQLVNAATKMFGTEVDIEIVEAHHKMKKDAPSGTAKSLGEAVTAARGVPLEKVECDGRSGEALRKPGEVGIHAVRGGDVVGEHTVFFFADGERVEITHRATKRSIFADGAVRAALWLAEQKVPGMYSMRDVLGV